MQRILMARWQMIAVLAATWLLSAAVRAQEPAVEPSDPDPVVEERIDALEDAWKDRRQTRDAEATEVEEVHGVRLDVGQHLVESRRDDGIVVVQQDPVRGHPLPVAEAGRAGTFVGFVAEPVGRIVTPYPGIQREHHDFVAPAGRLPSRRAAVLLGAGVALREVLVDHEQELHG